MQRGMTRRRMAAAAIAVAGTAAGACAPGQGGGSAEKAPGGVPNRPISLTHLNQGAGVAGPFFEHAVAVFREKHPQVSVEYVPNTPPGNVMEKFLTLSAAGTSPDVVVLNPPYVEPLRARGMLADLTPYVRRDARTFKPEDFHEATLARATRGGKWHAIPENLGLWFLIYNTSAFQGVGAGTPDASWTWDRLVDVVRQARAKDSSVLGMSMPPYELPLRANGGDILSKDEKKCLLDEPAAVEAIQWNGDLRQRHRVVPHPDEMAGQDNRKLFDAGRLVVHVADPGFLNTTQRQQVNFAWDIATLPRGKAARVSTVKGPSVSLSSEAKEQDTAWAWVGHFMGPEMQRYRAVETLSLTGRQSGLKAYLEKVEGFNKQALLDVASIARPMPYIAKFDEMDKEIRAGLDQVYGGQQPARTAMAEVARKVNAILATIG
jgi:multiple sugar transport system substrate-binding protein